MNSDLLPVLFPNLYSSIHFLFVRFFVFSDYIYLCIVISFFYGVSISSIISSEMCLNNNPIKNGLHATRHKNKLNQSFIHADRWRCSSGMTGWGEECYAAFQYPRIHRRSELWKLGAPRSACSSALVRKINKHGCHGYQC